MGSLFMNPFIQIFLSGNRDSYCILQWSLHFSGEHLYQFKIQRAVAQVIKTEAYLFFKNGQPLSSTFLQKGDSSHRSPEILADSLKRIERIFSHQERARVVLELIFGKSKVKGVVDIALDYLHCTTT